MNDSIPKTLCKYVTADGLINILETGKLKFSAARLFNDPFDLTINPWDIDLKDFREDLETEIKIAISDNADLPNHLGDLRNYANAPDTTKENLNNEIKKWCDQIIERQKINQEDLKAGAKANLEKIRVLSLTTEHNNLLMWAHYADSHKGAVLKFRGNDEFFKKVLNVEYEKDLATSGLISKHIRFGMDLTTNPAIDFLRTKSSYWRYEQEWRLMGDAVNPVMKREFHLFPPHALKEIYLGCKIQEDKIEEVRSLINGNFKHVKIFKASKNQKEFKLDIDPI